MSGYQSDVNIEDLDFVGDFPVENSLGGYGETTGAGDDYGLTLDPPISAYRVGMHLQMKFNHANAGAATLDVNGQGAVSMQKIVSNALADLDGGDLNSTRIYDLIYDGAFFQVTSGIISGLPQASEGAAGIAEVATQGEVDGGVDDSRIVTPLKLATRLASTPLPLASELQPGIAEIATQAEVDTGLDDARMVTVFKLAVLLNNRNATELQTGLAGIATQAQVNTGTDDTRMVTPLKLATRLAAALLAFEGGLGNPPVSGYVLSSTNAGVRSWRSVNSRLFTSYGTFAGFNGVLEVNLGSTYTMPAAQLNVLIGDQALEINISGAFLNALGNKTLRVYIGTALIFTYTSNITGNWSIRIIGGRFSTNIFKGQATIIHAGGAQSQVVQTAGLQMDSTDQLIRITHQNAVSALGQLNRFSFIVQHIV